MVFVRLIREESELGKKVCHFDGTFVTLRINTNKIKNIYDYLERREYDKNE